MKVESDYFHWPVGYPQMNYVTLGESLGTFTLVTSHIQFEGADLNGKAIWNDLLSYRMVKHSWQSQTKTQSEIVRENAPQKSWQVQIVSRLVAYFWNNFLTREKATRPCCAIARPTTIMNKFSSHGHLKKFFKPPI